MNIEKEINEYLFYEFGYDLKEEEGKISSNWPFELKYIDEIFLNSGTIKIYKFAHDGEDYYAFNGRVLDYLPVSGIDTKYLKYQLIGQDWLRQRNPIDLTYSILCDPAIPSIKNRIRAITKLCEKVKRQEFDILEGLFFRDNKKYLSLIQYKGEDNAYIIGNDIIYRNIPFPNMLSSQRLAIGIGMLISKGDIA